MNVKERLNEKITLSRWQVLKIGMLGMIAGAVLMFMFALAGIL